MTNSNFAGTERAPIGAYKIATTQASLSPHRLRDGIRKLCEPVAIVQLDGQPAFAEHGEAILGAGAVEHALPLLAYVPSLLPEQLGSAAFRKTYALKYAYVAGEMANGIASETLVEAIAQAGMLGIFGAAGLSLSRIEEAIVRLKKNLSTQTWGVNLIHSPQDAKSERETVELLLREKVNFVSASAF